MFVFFFERNFFMFVDVIIISFLLLILITIITKNILIDALVYINQILQLFNEFKK
jgi:hypothetical protein